MAVELNHTIVLATDPDASAAFLAGVLGLEVQPPWGYFVPVRVANGVTLDYMGVDGAVTPQHYAFLVSEDEFDAIHARLLDGNVPIWADPAQTRPGEINDHDGGRGVYFADPDGHLMEAITRPYSAERGGPRPTPPPVEWTTP